MNHYKTQVEMMRETTYLNMHNSDDEGNNNDDLQESSIITLKNTMGKMHKRMNESILCVK